MMPVSFRRWMVSGDLKNWEAAPVIQSDAVTSETGKGQQSTARHSSVTCIASRFFNKALNLRP